MTDASRIEPSTHHSYPVAGPWSGTIVLVASLAAILGADFYRPVAKFDEPFFIRNCELFSAEGLTRRFLEEMREQAPGPTYQLIHYVLSSFTGYDVVWMRLMTIGMLLTSVVLWRRWSASASGSDFAADTLRFLAVPTTWVFGTMVLTQMPGMVCALGFLAVAKLWRGLPAAALAGVLLGLAILGRVHYAALVLVCAFEVLRTRDRTAVVRNAVIVATAAAICMPVFMVWGGYVPRDQSGIFADGDRFHVHSVFIAFDFLFLFMLIDHPRCLLRPGVRLVVPLLAACLAINIGAGLFPHHFRVISTLLFFLPEAVTAFVPVPVYAVIALFMISHFIDTAGLKKFSERSALGLVIIATALSGLRSSRFTDGYVFQVLPLVFAYHGFVPRSRWFVPKYAALAVVGFLYLLHRLRVFG